MLLLLSISPVQAQDDIEFGFKFGLTSSEFRTSEGFGNRARESVNVGAFSSIPLRGGLSALVSADYFRKGYGAGELRSRENERLGTDADFQFDYASLLAGLQLSAMLNLGDAILYTYTGPRLDLLVAERVEVTNRDGDRETLVLDPEQRGDFLEYNSAVLGATIALGLNLAEVLPLPILGELRLDADVTPVSSSGDTDFRFRTFSLRLGLSF